MEPASPAMPAAARRGLIARIAACPGRALAAVLALHAAVWTALPALLYPNLPLDLIEALMYGREWQLGYDKLPPLPWWLVRDRLPTVGHDFAYYLLAELAVIAAFALVYAAARPLVGRARRAGCGADRRRSALLQLHRRQVQSRRHPAAVLGAGRICLPPRAARPADRGLAAARLGARPVAVGEIFRGGAGSADGAVRADRPRRAQGAGNARALYRGRRRADHGGAASGLAGEDRFPALGLCRAPRRAVARLVRPSLASAAVRRQPTVLPDPVAADRRRRCSSRAASRTSRSPSQRPTPSMSASSPGLPSGRWRRCWRCRR